MDSQWNPVPQHFIEFVVAKTNGFKLDSTNQNVIYMQETCVRAYLQEANAEHEHFIFQGEFAKCSSVSHWHEIRRKSTPRGGILFASTKNVHWTRSRSLLHFDIGNILWIRTGKLLKKSWMLARSDCFPQPCSSTSHMFYRENITFKYYRLIASFQTRFWWHGL